MRQSISAFLCRSKRLYIGVLAHMYTLKFSPVLTSWYLETIFSMFCVDFCWFLCWEIIIYLIWAHPFLCFVGLGKLGPGPWLVASQCHEPKPWALWAVSHGLKRLGLPRLGSTRFAASSRAFYITRTPTPTIIDQSGGGHKVHSEWHWTTGGWDSMVSLLSLTGFEGSGAAHLAGGVRKSV